MQIDLQRVEEPLQDLPELPPPVLNGPRSSGIVTLDQSDKLQNSKLFEDAVVTDASSEMAITTFISRHHLTETAQGDLLDLVRLHMPSHGKSVASSVCTLRKYSAINPVAAQCAFHYLCPQCFCSLPDKNHDVCPNASCKLSLYDDEDEAIVLPHFLTVSISEQLQIILKSKSSANHRYAVCVYMNSLI